MSPPQFELPLTLDNCDAEPIHIPGAIQPHGALLVLESPGLVVRSVSDNTAAVLGVPPAQILGASIDGLLDAEAVRVLRANENGRSWKRVNPLPVEVKGRRFDAVVHRVGAELVVELEPLDLVGQGDFRHYAADTHQSLLQLHACETIADLLEVAADQVRRVTGYDRVMVYRFDADDHGEVVAEAKLPRLEAFLGLHYPASDIPAQARRLYLLNWLRIIGDVDYVPAKLLAAPGPPGLAERPPLDMSFSVLRSVSPIHLEYLRNMGVGASMSVSLVIGGKLWGLIACHHYSPMYVPYAVRMTCELLGQSFSTLLATKLSAEAQVQKLAFASRRVELLAALSSEPYFISALRGSARSFLDFVGAAGAALLERQRYDATGAGASERLTRAIAAKMVETKTDVFVTDGAALDHPDLAAADPQAAGVLAIGFPADEGNVLVWLRPEQQRTVSWAGEPGKVYSEGPNGPRLSPRGSFALWLETVRGRSVAWTPAQVEAARELRVGLIDVAARQAMEAVRDRDMVLGMVSHDLRSPLGAISMSASLLEQPESATPEQLTYLSSRIASSSDRMRGMVEHLLDFTRSRTGNFELQLVELDLVPLCQQLVSETELGHPGVRITTSLPGSCRLRCDPGRLSQAISNLLGNARHHGDVTRPISLRVREEGAAVHMEVHNFGAIAPEVLPFIFEPFRRASGGTAVTRHKAGLGLGLYIVRAVVEAHGGEISVVSSVTEGTRFSITLPKVMPSSATKP